MKTLTPPLTLTPGTWAPHNYLWPKMLRCVTSQNFAMCHIAKFSAAILSLATILMQAL